VWSRFTRNRAGADDPVLGHLDGVDRAGAFGWAYNRLHPTIPVEVEIMVDGRPVLRAWCRERRADVRAAGHPVDRCGFRVALPASVADGRGHVVRARVVGTTRELMGSGVRVHGRRGRRTQRPAKRAAAMTALREMGSRDALVERIRETGRVAIVAVYRPAPIRLAYHDYYLRRLRALGFAVVVVDTTPQPQDAVVEESADLTFLRSNVGWDFASWILGLTRLRDALADAQEILLTNDSVFGPIHPLEDILSLPQLEGADFWGMTDSWQHAYHLQSYFVVLRRPVVESRALWRFVERFDVGRDKAYAIDRGEVRLTTLLLEEGFEVGVGFPYGETAERWLESVPSRLEALTRDGTASYGDDSAHWSIQRSALLDAADMLERGIPTNPTHLFWDTLITEFGFPFLKRELLFANPLELAVARTAASVVGATDYPFEHLVEAGRFLEGARALVGPPSRAAPRSS
jgi:hypothetical protein